MARWLGGLKGPAKVRVRCTVVGCYSFNYLAVRAKLRFMSLATVFVISHETSGGPGCWAPVATDVLLKDCCSYSHIMQWHRDICVLLTIIVHGELV